MNSYINGWSQLPSSQISISHSIKIGISVFPLNWNASNSILACGSVPSEIILVVGSFGMKSSMMTYSENYLRINIRHLIDLGLAEVVELERRQEMQRSF